MTDKSTPDFSAYKNKNKKKKMGGRWSGYLCNIDHLSFYSN